MKKVFLFKNSPVEFKADCYKTVMVNIIDLGKIMNKDPFAFLESDNAQKYMSVLRKQIEEIPPTPEDKILDIESSSHVYVNVIIALEFIGEYHQLNFWFWEAKDQMSFELVRTSSIGN